MSDEFENRDRDRSDPNSNGDNTCPCEESASTTTSPTPSEPQPSLDQNAAIRIIADLIAAGVRVVCRGEGTVHLFPAVGSDVPQPLMDRLQVHYTTINVMV